MSRPVVRALPVVLPVVLLGVVGPAFPVQAATVVPAPEFSVEVVTANGSGCPDTSASARVLPDGSSFTIDFGGYYAWSGAGAPATAFRRNCQFSLQISRPDGLTYAVEEAQYSGFALLADGVTGLRATRYYFQGQSGTIVGSQQFAGPAAEVWESVDSFGPESLAFAPCFADRNLNVNTELRLRPLFGSTDLNVMVMDSTITMRLTWRTCA